MAAAATTFTDKNLVCKDCSAAFVFTEGEQQFYSEKGFENEPTRCKDCRKVKKDARRASYRARRGERAPRAEGEASAPRAPRAPRADGDKPKGVCFAFQKGECNRGDACRYQHVAA